MLIKLTRDEAHEFSDAATISVERLEDPSNGLDELPLGTTLSAAQSLQKVIEENMGTSNGSLYVFIPLITPTLREAAIDAINLNAEHYEEVLSDNVFVEQEDIIRSVELTKSIQSKLSRF